VVGTVGRESGQCRLRVVAHSDGQTLRQQVHDYTQSGTVCYTDEWLGYNGVQRAHGTVCHGQGEWARDDDGDGVREVHINTLEGLWTAVRNFLRPFRGVHKRYLQHYVAMCEHRINRKRVSPEFIAGLVAAHKA
jgi:transposase-like protein